MSSNIKSFKDLITDMGVFSDGDWVESKDQDPSGDVRLIQLADIGVGKFINKSKRFMTYQKANDLNCTFLEEGDILIARMPDPIGRACIFPGVGCKAVTVVDICIVRPNNAEIDSRWLMHLINSNKFNHQILQYVTGTTRLRISRGNLAKLDVEVPPLEEQKRIAAILDKADVIRHKRKQAIDLADEFLRSVFLDMFGDPVTNPKGWEERKLITGLSKVQSGWSAKGESYPCASNELGVLKVSAVTSGYFKDHENKFVSKDIIPEGKRLLFPKKGDLLFSRANTRELVAATCIVTRDYDNVFLPDKLWKVETNENLIPEFLHMLIQQPRFKERLTSQATGSSGSMLNISKSKFEQTISIFPSIEEQVKFKEIYWKVMKSLASLETSEMNVGDFFNSLSQKAFSGQL